MSDSKIQSSLSQNPARKLNLILLLCTILLFFISLQIETYTSNFEFALILILFAVLGMPHGAMDHIVNRRLQGVDGEDKAIDKIYIRQSWIKMGVFAVVWILFPLFSFIVFILMSAYHFGESQLYTYFIHKGNKIKRFAYTIWGLAILCILMILKLEETQISLVSLFPGFTSESTLYLFIVNYELTILVGLLTTTLLSLIYLTITKNMAIIDLIIEVIILGCLLMVFYYTSLFVGFLCYFGIWHSVKAIQQIFLFHKKNGITYSIKKFYAQTAGITAVIIVVMIGMLIIDHYLEGLGDHVLLFFILVSILTLPHTLLFAKMNARHG